MFNINDRFNYRTNDYSTCKRCLKNSMYRSSFFGNFNKQYNNKYNSYYEQYDNIEKDKNQYSYNELYTMINNCKKLDNISNREINDVLNKLHIIIERMSIGTNKLNDSHNAYVRMEQWNEKLLNELRDTNKLDETKALEEEIDVLMIEIRALIDNSLEMIKEAEEKLLVSIQLNDYMKQLKSKYENISYKNEKNRYY